MVRTYVLVNVISEHDSHCDRIHSCLTAVHCFDDGYVGKQPVAWKEQCEEKRTQGKRGNEHWPQRYK